MAESTASTASPAGKGGIGGNGVALRDDRPTASASQNGTERPPPSKPLRNQIYSLPAPIRTFPLPTFYPNNPISLLHLVYAWLSQVLRPPPREPSVVHTGVWDPETRSVHIRDESSIRALWEQGFYGKGSLSRSEPNWLQRELARRGSPEGKTVSEARTELRREERRLAKWERAKAELEALERQRLAEAAAQAAVREESLANGVVAEPAEIVHSSSSLSAPSVELSDSSLTGAETSTSADIKAVASAVQVALSQKPDGDLLDDRQGHRPPVSPLELLALPNSLADLNRLTRDGTSRKEPVATRFAEHKAPVGPAELLLLPNSHADLVARPVSGLAIFEAAQPAPSQPTLQPSVDTSRGLGHKLVNGTPAVDGAVEAASAKASALADISSAVSTLSNGNHSDTTNTVLSPSSEDPTSTPAEETAAKLAKRRKSVRFSPTVESTTFADSDPPSPNRSGGTPNGAGAKFQNGEAATASEPVTPAQLSAASTAVVSDIVPSVVKIENKEHFQLAPEEAFFLAFSLGVLKVVDPVAGSPISNEHLLSLLRAYSYFPPRSPGSDLQPDDPFLVNYAVYHHFRSLGWVPRHGIKFGVDWIIYQRGPVFDHSEFGIMVMPSYSDAAWEEHQHDEPKRSWSWLMGVNRVLSHVLKSLVLVYVDIPAPSVFEEEIKRGGIAAALKKYTIREVMVRRFSVNRNR